MKGYMFVSIIHEMRWNHWYDLFHY